MKKAPNSAKNAKDMNEISNEAVALLFHELKNCPPMSRQEEKERIQEMVRMRDERDLIAQLISEKDPEEVSDDERKKLQRAQRAYEKIRNVFIQRNLRLVAKIAKRYVKGSSMEITDFVSEGSIGIMRAVDKFDPEQGVRFATYAGHWIRQAMNRYAQNNGRTVRYPVNIQLISNKIKKVQKEALTHGGQEPTVEELAEYIGKSVGAIKSAIEYQQSSIASLDAPINGTDPSSGSYVDWISDEDTIPQDEVLDRRRNIEELQEVVETLNERDKKILELRHGLEGEDAHTLQEIGDRFGLSRERIRQINDKIRKDLRKELVHAMDSAEML